MNCPDCRLLLSQHKVGLFTLESCGSCHGIWIDRDEALALSRAIRHGAKYSPPAPSGHRLSGVRKCGRCAGAPMMLVRYNNLDIDVCSSCKGIWLDYEEVRPIIVRHTLNPRLGVRKPADPLPTGKPSSGLQAAVEGAHWLPWDFVASVGDIFVVGAESAVEVGGAVLEMIVGVVSSI